MKLFIIWTVAATIALAPLGWLATRNPRALLIGAWLTGLVLVFYVGAFAVGMVPAEVMTRAAARDYQARVATHWLTILAVFVALAVLNLYLMKGPASQRLVWTLWSTLIWTFVLGVMYAAWDQVQEVQRQAASDAVWDEARLREAEVQRLRAELDRFPDRRRAVIDSALIEVRKHVALHFERLERVLVFGDPATAPADVVVWGVLSIRPEFGWQSFGLHGQQSHELLNTQLRRRGYPHRIALGFAPTSDVDSAGGDEPYFGRDGSAVIPQFPSNTKVGQRPGPLEVPRRRPIQPRQQ